jgi:hypothetical protein
MRYINITGFSPSLAWLDRSRIATEELERKTSLEERLMYLKANAQIWRDLRQELIDSFGSRCWFTDAEETVAQLDTEHFRPKAQALDIDGTPHEGYWWLAFEFSNLRLAGQIPNRQHKKCYFPLLPGSVRANSQQRHWQEENPVFLDPTRPTDVELVAYDDAGVVRPSLSAETDEDRKRVEVTDNLLGLSSHQPLIEARQRIWADCRGIIAQVENLKAEERTFGVTPRTRGERDRLYTELRAKTLAKEPYSSVAKSCIQLSGRPWAQTIIGA